MPQKFPDSNMGWPELYFNGVIRMPEWLILLQIILRLEPEVVNAIDLLKLPAKTPDQIKAILDSMDAAVSEYQRRVVALAGV